MLVATHTTNGKDANANSVRQLVMRNMIGIIVRAKSAKKSEIRNTTGGSAHAKFADCRHLMVMILANILANAVVADWKGTTG
jgi:hypothetical protein